jgi:hypothetical protein
MSLPYFTCSGGVKRVLGAIPSTAGQKKAARKFADHNPVLPRSQWYALSRRDVCPWILNQGDHGSCVANGAVGGLRRARFLAGATDVPLGPGALYAQVNGGQDNGAIIADGISALTTKGTCSFNTVGQEPIYLDLLPTGWGAEAKRFRSEQVYHAGTYDEIVSGILLGFIAVYGFMVGDNFESYDQYGVAGRSNGPGNHCNGADGVALLPDGRWVLDDFNSWDYSWGPWQNGRVYISEAHLMSGGDNADAWLIQAPREDPLEPLEPPHVS